MNRAIAIAAREVRERTFVLLFAVATALMPFAATLLPKAAQYGRLNMIAAVGVILSVAVAFGLAIALGSSVVGRELSDRRLSFYFNKPVGALSIWFGKLLGAIVLVSVTFAIIYTPSALVGQRAWSTNWTFGALTGASIILGSAAVMTLVAHAASTMIRSRSAVLAVDVALLVGFGAAAWYIVEPFLSVMAIQVGKWLMAGLFAIFVIALIGAGAWQLSLGRTDLKRSHAEMSKFLWVAMAIGFAIVGAYAWWVLAAAPSDLEKPEMFQSASGEWAVVGGPARHRGDFIATFVMNVRTGEWRRFPAARWSGANFTHDGKAIWATSPLMRRSSAMELYMQRLGIDEEPVPTGLTLNGGSDLVFSDDLTRVAEFGKVVAVHELGSKRLLASVRLPYRANHVRGFFVNRSLLRLIAVTNESAGPIAGPQTLRIYELDVPSRRLQMTGQWSTVARVLSVSASPDGSVLAVGPLRGPDGKGLFLIDGRTAAVRWSSSDITVAGFRSVRVLTDGRVVVLEGHQQGRRMQVLGSDGTLRRSIELPGVMYGSIAGEAGGGKVVVAARYREGPERGPKGWQTLVVDIDGGTIVRSERDAYVEAAWFWTDPRPPGKPKVEYLIADGNDLWRWNALSGARKALLE
jgi:hypothetical protein